MRRSVILFLAGNPARSCARAVDRECAAIERELAMTPARDEFELRSKWAVTIDEMMRHLFTLSPDVLHFCGHGDPAGLVLPDDAGAMRVVAPAALSRIFDVSPTAQLAVLSGCYSDAQAMALRDSVGCVIGVRGQVSDDDARAFAVGLYRALGYRRSIGNAYQQALAVLEGQALGARGEPRCLVRPGVSVDTVILSRAARHDRAGRDEALVEHGQRREWHVEDLE